MIMRYLLSHVTPGELSLKLQHVQLAGGSAAQPVRGAIFSDVFKGKYKGQDVCVKRLRIFEDAVTRKGIYDDISREAAVWRTLRHPSVLAFIGLDVATFEPMLALVTPWMEWNITEYCNRFTPGSSKLYTMIVEIAEGLEYIHSQRVVHGDLRGANILIDKHSHVQIADTGLIPFADIGTAKMTAVGGGSGPGRWMAPELHVPSTAGLTESRRTPKTDIFAFGVACIEVYTRRPPFAEIQSDHGVFLAVVQNRRPARPSQAHCFGAVFPDKLWDVAQRCWAQLPDERPAAAWVVRQLKS